MLIQLIKFSPTKLKLSYIKNVYFVYIFQENKNVNILSKKKKKHTSKTKEEDY